MTEQTSNPIPNADVSAIAPPLQEGGSRHNVVGSRLWRGLSVAVAAGSMLTPLACSNEGSDKGGATDQEAYNGEFWLSPFNDTKKIEDGDHVESNYVTYFTEKLGDHNTDPAFRASTATFLTGVEYNVSPRGVGVLLKQGDKYVIATTEHVTDGLLFDREPSFERDPEDVIASNTPEVPRTKDGGEVVRLFVPGVGSMRLNSSNTVIQQDSTYGAQDPEKVYMERFSVISLNDEQQDFIRDAEESGAIKLPELSVEKPERGELIYMPLAESGRNIPLIFVGLESGRLEAYPAILFDNTGDAQKAVEKFRELTEEARQEMLKEWPGEPDPKALNYRVLEKVQDDFLARYNRTSDPIIKQNLPCEGDSGSPVLDKSGKVLGTLGIGYDTGEFGKYISRDPNMDDNSLYRCLFDVEFSVPSAA